MTGFYEMYDSDLVADKDALILIFFSGTFVVKKSDTWVQLNGIERRGSHHLRV